MGMGREWVAWYGVSWALILRWRYPGAHDGMIE